MAIAVRDILLRPITIFNPLFGLAEVFRAFPRDARTRTRINDFLPRPPTLRGFFPARLAAISRIASNWIPNEVRLKSDEREFERILPCYRARARLLRASLERIAILACYCYIWQKGAKKEEGGGRGGMASQRLDYGNCAVDKIVERYDDLLECNSTIYIYIYIELRILVIGKCADKS